MGPVGTRTGFVDIFDSGYKILNHPGVVGIANTMLLANLPNRWSDKRVPGTAHAGEQVVLNLEVESAGQASGYESTVGGRGFDL